MESVDARRLILWANQFELALLGYTPYVNVGHVFAEFCVDAGMLSNSLSRLQQGATLTEEPARLRCKDGSIRDVLVTSNVRYEDGKLMDSRYFTRDVTDQQRAVQGLKDAEERAERSQAFLAALVESADDAIVSKSLDSRIKSWNRGAERLFGYRAEEVIGESILILIPPELQYQEHD